MLKMIDLFAGIGGIRIAFENNGVKCVMSSEIDKYACNTYYMNFNEMPWGDITKIEAEEIPDFDIITGGFPCQPFSIGGYRKGFKDTRGTLFFELERIIKIRKPKAFFLENVSGIISHDKGKTLEIIEKRLKKLGYHFRWKVMNACYYGIPQNRNRWYCVGFRNDLDIGFEDETNSDYKKIFKFPRKRELSRKVSDVVVDIDDRSYQITDTAKKNIEKHLPDYLSSDRYAQHNRHIIIASEIRPSRCNFRSDGISPCLTAKMGTGGNNVPVYVKQMRKLTERECLQIMGFPKDYKIKKNNYQSYKQIGNSVVVPLVQEIAKGMVDVLR